MALAIQSVSSPSSSSSIRNSRPLTGNSNACANAKFLVDWNNPSTAKPKGNNENLQEAFQRFREQRMNEIQLHEKLKTRRRKKLRRSDPERMYRLRMKFVEQAKKYLGVPYAKKYFEPGTPEYESKIFLDCCGLVRRVMYDLAKDFGFIIGPWNQSYMYDTLPRTITNLSEVKPGDLVFISAIYYNSKMKKQRHNLTHVEIMLGEGEKTIGARWNNGKVQFFDSYKFISKSYHSQIYTIKSLDPWLKGICQSYCSEHFWRRRKPLKVTRKSIFYSSNEHQRVQSSKPRKVPSGSSLSSCSSSTKSAHHRRKRKHRSKRSKSRKHSNSGTFSPEKPIGDNEQISSTSVFDIRSSSDDENESMERINNQLADVTCEDRQDLCDDSDSLDEALDAELLDEDPENTFISSSSVQ